MKVKSEAGPEAETMQESDLLTCSQTNVQIPFFYSPGSPA